MAVSLLAAVPAAEANGLNASQVNAVVALLQSFDVSAATIANVENALTGSPATPAPSSVSAQANAGGNGPSFGLATAAAHASSCSAISQNLNYGDSSEAVTKLQQFLAKDKSVYPEGLVTGFFGHATEDAIQRYQTAHGIVATGTPSTTGYGAVGPKTLGEIDHEMETECGGGDSGSSIATSTGSQESNSGGQTATSSESSSSSSDN